MFKKTARRSGRCGECVYYNADKGICAHPKMDEKEVGPAQLTACGGKYYKPKDDYEDN